MSANRPGCRGFAMYWRVYMACTGALSSDVARAAGLGKSSAGCVLNQMRTLGLVRRVKVKANHTISYAWFQGRDEEFTTKIGTVIAPGETLKSFKVLVYSLSSPCSRSAAAKAMNVHSAVVRRHLKFAHDNGYIFIAGWKTRAGSPTPLYQIGPGVDAERPTAMTRSQLNRRHRARLKKERDLDRQLQDRARNATLATLSNPALLAANSSIFNIARSHAR